MYCNCITGTCTRTYNSQIARAENDLFFVWGSIDMVFVWVVELDLVFVWVVELDLVFVCGPKITWF